METPTTLRQLVSFLTGHPRVLCHHPITGDEIRVFLGVSRGRLVFREEDSGLRRYPPILDPLTDGEMGVAFGDKGFIATKYDVVTSIEYLA